MVRRQGAGRRPEVGVASIGDQGSIALELAIIAPMLIGILVLMLAYGRQAQVSGIVESAARDGARVATHSRSFDEAQDRVAAAVADNLEQAPPSCRTTSGYSLGDEAAFLAGASVTVEVSCDLSYTDIGLPIPTQRLTRTFVSRLDPYRGVR